jgi:hypothetical protein
MNAIPKQGAIDNPIILKQYAGERRTGMWGGLKCDCGCGKDGSEVVHNLRGCKRTDEFFNLGWMTRECHAKFDSQGIKTRIWLFELNIRRRQCTLQDVLFAQFRFQFEY